MTKAWILMFDSNYDARLVKAEVEDGTVIIDDKEFIVDETNPLLLRAGLFKGYKPLYIVKWDSLEPMQIMPNFNKKGNPSNIDPKTFRRMSDMRILSNLVRPVRKVSFNFIWMILGIGVGAIILYALITFGFMPI